MVKSSPKVSVIVPVFNEPVEILEESFTSLMSQIFEDFECIVIDESTKLELAYACENICARDSRFRYLHPVKRLGLPGSLNLAISMSRGELLARFDSDDVCFPQRLAIQVAFMDANREVGVVGAGLEIIDENGCFIALRRYPQLSIDIARKLQSITPLAHPTVVYRASVVHAHGAYDTSYKYSEDLDLWLRWLNKGVIFANVPEILVKYRQAHTQRHFNHWKYNLRARVRNLSPSFLFRRLVGIACISIWSILPKFIQEFFFRFLIF
jgi:glycosyltransferase involved in cell wall biosynthesis